MKAAWANFAPGADRLPRCVSACCPAPRMATRSRRRSMLCSLRVSRQEEVQVGADGQRPFVNLLVFLALVGDDQ